MILLSTGLVHVLDFCFGCFLVQSPKRKQVGQPMRNVNQPSAILGSKSMSSYDGGSCSQMHVPWKHKGEIQWALWSISCSTEVEENQYWLFVLGKGHFVEEAHGQQEIALNAKAPTSTTLGIAARRNWFYSKIGREIIYYWALVWFCKLEYKHPEVTLIMQFIYFFHLTGSFHAD